MALPDWARSSLMRAAAASLSRRVVVRARVPDALEVAAVRPVRLEAGESPRGLADVELAVATAEREQLHQLARVVLVRRALVGIGEREEEQHRRVGGHRLQERRERPERAAA